MLKWAYSKEEKEKKEENKARTIILNFRECKGD